jgi:glycosyltransferase involved in cell wall biosynthesis
MPLLPSGVAGQTRYIIEALLDSGKFQVISLGGAVKHQSYDPIVPDHEKYGKDWVVFPVDSYGDATQIRRVLLNEKPDILYFMTDPRFYEWLWRMEDEIRANIPMVYYHVWDNKPIPVFNKNFYDSTDAIVTISKITSECVQGTSPEVEEIYQPHAVDPNIFRKRDSSEDLAKIANIRSSTNMMNKTLFFWNNRNARRKQSGSLIFWFKEFLDKVGHDKAGLIVHTEVRDPHGQPLDYLVSQLGLDKGQVWFSKSKVSAEDLSLMYNAADCVVNIADAEGFGLSSLEALSCETLVINTMTGGLQEQVFDGEQYFGVGIDPASRAVIGSQAVPFIYEDRLAAKDVISAFEKIHNMSDKEKEEIGKKARHHVETNYNFEKYKEFWVSYLQDLHERLGSWETRKNYNRWEMKTL